MQLYSQLYISKQCMLSQSTQSTNKQLKSLKLPQGETANNLIWHYGMMLKQLVTVHNTRNYLFTFMYLDLQLIFINMAQCVDVHIPQISPAISMPTYYKNKSRYVTKLAT